MKTGKITYNVRERGRRFRGQDRNFDTAALAALVNGPAVQEKVAKGDMHGYFGHGVREIFGMDPGEVGVLDNKVIPLEPALATTLLRAHPDGTIEHEAAFMDTALGRTAQRMFSNKRGGFSSAIAVHEVGGRDVPIAFHGFDYVLEPNFSTNRGYALDGLKSAPGVVLDEVVREGQAALVLLDGMYSELQANFDQQAQTLARVLEENRQLVDMIARGKADPASAKAALARLDSTEFRTPIRTRTGEAPSHLARVSREFMSIDLPTFTTHESADAKKLGALVSGFLSKGMDLFR